MDLPGAGSCARVSLGTIYRHALRRTHVGIQRRQHRRRGGEGSRSGPGSVRYSMAAADRQIDVRQWALHADEERTTGADDRWIGALSALWRRERKADCTDPVHGNLLLLSLA